MRRFAAFALVTTAGAVAAAAGTGAAASRPQTFDLAAGTVNGRVLLGRPLVSVTAAFGRPDARHIGRPGARSWIRYGSRDAFRLLVYFNHQRGRWIARTVVLQNPAVTETRLGHPLRLSPEQLQEAIRLRYADVFQQDSTLEYQCLRGLCTGGFTRISGRGGITFGRVRARTFVSVWRP